jgi:5'-3' exonuclease
MNERPQVLLIDGMGMLVRAAKAAANMSLLSHNGTDTRVLVAFSGSLVRILRAAPWTHVVVAWEGYPELNWRKKFWPEYKSSRPWHRDGAPVMSRGEELAMELIEAAGIHQTWESTMEGDDIIAGAWRQFRASGLDPQITIFSADRDLLQLVEPPGWLTPAIHMSGTVWRSWTNCDVDTTAEHVRATWGAEPARLPLLRALAGDPSDGIPGVMSIGPVKAARMVSGDKPNLAILHSLATTLGLEKQARVYCWWVISELREPVLAPQLDLGERCERAEWHPALHSDAFRAFLRQWGMRRLGSRMDDGDLPWPPVPDKEPA